jgi:hypothetical protein
VLETYMASQGVGGAVALRTVPMVTRVQLHISLLRLGNRIISLPLNSLKTAEGQRSIDATVVEALISPSFFWPK